MIARQKYYEYLSLGVLKSGSSNISGPVAVVMLLEPEKKHEKQISPKIMRLASSGKK